MPGVIYFYVVGARIEHNEIYDLPYTAISLGWGWDCEVGCVCSAGQQSHTHCTNKIMIIHSYVCQVSVQHSNLGAMCELYILYNTYPRV